MKSKIAILSNEGEFCMNLVSISSNRYDLFFPKKQSDIVNSNIKFAIIDLNDKSVNPFDIVKGHFLLIGVMNSLNKKIELKARDAGYNITFTKKMLLKNFTTIIGQLNNG